MKLCPDCGKPMSLKDDTYSCLPCDVHIDKKCEEFDKKLSGLNMEQLAEHMQANGLKELTMTPELARQFEKE